MGVHPVRRAQTRLWQTYADKISEHVGKPLREQCDDIAHEPLPERWVDLISYLNAQEKEQRRAKTPPHDRRRPLPH